MKISDKIKELVNDANDIINEYDEYINVYLEINISYDLDFSTFSAVFDTYELGIGRMNKTGTLFEIVKDKSLTAVLDRLQIGLHDFKCELEEEKQKEQDNDIKYFDGKKYRLVK